TAAYGGGTNRIATATTDLRARAEAAMQKAAFDAAANTQAEAPVAAQAMASTATDMGEAVPEKVEDLIVSADSAKTSGFVHPGLLHNEEDFTRMRTHKGREPWKSGWERLTANNHASLNYKPRPVENVVRGRDRLATAPENYA